MKKYLDPFEREEKKARREKYQAVRKKLMDMNHDQLKRIVIKTYNALNRRSNIESVYSHNNHMANFNLFCALKRIFGIS